jgi:hypothetical protein
MPLSFIFDFASGVKLFQSVSVAVNTCSQVLGGHGA